MNDLIKILNTQWTEELLLTNPFHLDLLTQQADQIISSTINKKELTALDVKLSPDENINLGPKVALKLAISKITVNAITKKSFVGVVLAVNNEHNRMLTAEENDNGEDFLHRKIKQRKWLFDDNHNVSWEMIMVDDDCPNGSRCLGKFY